MATANPLREDNYELELSRVREKIKTKFVELIDCLKARESELLRQLDNILTSYLSYRIELEKISDRKIEIEETKIYHQNKLQSSRIKSVHENFISQLDTELESIETPIEPKMVSFECDNNKMLAELNNLGKLVEKVRSGIDYKSKKQPLVSVCKRGNGTGQLDNPCGVTYDSRTGNLYVVNFSSHCVKVFDSTAMYLFEFGDNDRARIMNSPRGITICGDRILITQGTSMNLSCILQYQLDGTFVSKIGKQGTGALEFNWPVGLTIDEYSGDIYICDCGNKRIQVLNKDFSFNSQFGIESLKAPRDVKLTKEFIFVLDQSNPCLHLFNYNHILQKSVISRGKGMLIGESLRFFIDNNGYILISDAFSSSIRIFNSHFELFHHISVSPIPIGITVDNKDRVIVVCQSDKDCLQIF